VGQAGTIKEVVARHKNGHLKPTSEATVDDHFGMNAQDKVGRGGGMGGGRGMGRGMGGGRGAGRGMGISGSGPSRKMGGSSQSRGQELEDLKHQADSLNEKMKEVISRINNLEG
jgi:hypothetical protein